MATVIILDGSLAHDHAHAQSLLMHEEYHCTFLSLKLLALAPIYIKIWRLRLITIVIFLGAPTAPLPVKSAWTWALESAVEYVRIVKDIAPQNQACFI